MQQQLEVISDLEAEVKRQAQEIRHLERELRQNADSLGRLHLQARTLETLSLNLFGILDAGQIYALLCESLVIQLGYSSAFVFAVKAQRASILGHYQATEKQLGHLRDYVTQDPFVMEAYGQRSTLTTRGSNQKAALSLRVLFQTDEVVALPILFGDHLFGYLVVCSHGKAAKEPTADELFFLSVLTSQLGHAVQNSQSLLDLEAQNSRLRQLDELKDSFISITSHQLRTPLSIIKWILSILQSDPSIEPLVEQKKLVDQAYESNERLIHVVNDLLNVSRIQEGKLPYSPQLTDVVQLVSEVAEASRGFCEGHHIRLEVTAEESLPHVEIDPLIFREAIQNLLDNAIDYNRENGWIRISIAKADATVRIVLENTGIGLTPDVQRRIFEQFYRAPEAIIAHPNGNGLGLFLSQAIIKQHGGNVTCVSVPGETTSFTVSIPITNV